MIKSETISNLSASLIEFHAKAKSIKTDTVNPYFNSKYASMSNILKTVTPILNECGLSIVQMVNAENTLTTILMHESGEYIGSTMNMMPIKTDPQAQGSAITYARRYAVGAILSLSIDEDDDGNTATYTEQQTQQTAQQYVSYEPNEDKNWLNATDKSGNPTQLAYDTAQLLSSGEYSWEALYSDYKVSRKDRAMLQKLVDESQVDV